MRTTVVTGVLGSGKTTFIQNFLRKSKEKAVVLVNDFGTAGIDGEIFSASGIESVELPSGCVCCTLRFDLITTVQRIVKQFAPEHLLIEPSGVASPAGVLEALASAGIGAATVIGIVDAVEFAELYEADMYGNFFGEQVEASEIILVNKTDIAEEVAIAAAEKLITSINPHALLFRTVNAVLAHPLRIGERTEARGDFDKPMRGDLSGQRDHCSFETHSFKLRSGYSYASLRTLFDGLAKGTYGSIVRAKALVQTSDGPYRFDIVYGRVDEARFDRDVKDSRLVVIGRGLDRLAMEQALLSGTRR